MKDGETYRGIYKKGNREMQYVMKQEKGKKNVTIPSQAATHYTKLGADMTILNNIGDIHPEKAIEMMLDSIPKEESSPE